MMITFKTIAEAEGRRRRRDREDPDQMGLEFPEEIPPGDPREGHFEVRVYYGPGRETRDGEEWSDFPEALDDFDTAVTVAWEQQNYLHGEGEYPDAFGEVLFFSTALDEWSAYFDADGRMTTASDTWLAAMKAAGYGDLKEGDRMPKPGSADEHAPYTVVYDIGHDTGELGTFNTYEEAKNVGEDWYNEAVEINVANGEDRETVAEEIGYIIYDSDGEMVD